MNEPWIEDVLRQAAWDRRVSRRPVCADCGKPILEELCLPVEDGEVICPGCIRWRMIEVDG